MNYNMNVNYDALAHSLRLNADQREMVEAVHDRFIRSMRKAGRATEAELQARSARLPIPS